MSTATDTLAAAGRFITAASDTKRAAADAYEAQNAARSALYAAERASRDAEAASEAATHQVQTLARALAYAGEPVAGGVERAYPSDAGRYEYRATFGRAAVTTRASSGRWSSKAQPQVAVAVGWTGGQTVELYQSPRGTSDEAKLEAELDKAHDAAQRWVATMTAGAWLDAHGLSELARDPAAARRLLDSLVTVTLELRRDYFQDRSYLSPRWTVAIGSTKLHEPLNTWDLWPATEDRDPLTRGEPESPAETNPETWHAYEAATRDYWNRADVRERALRAAGLAAD